tara:strand:+ start:499 stop:744 length:246 start_codon:yes stop_codon:yes gene_type:complete
MISNRCHGLNLLNHLKQKYEYKLEFEQIINKYHTNRDDWIVKFEFNNKVYEVIGKSKKISLEKIMDTALEDIYSIIKVKYI